MNRLLVLLSLFCFNSHLFGQNALEDQILRIVSHPIIQSYFLESSDIVIISNEICNPENCQILNDEKSKPIVLLEKEEAFTKGLDIYITIKEIIKTELLIEAKVITAKGRLFIITV